MESVSFDNRLNSITENISNAYNQIQQLTPGYSNTINTSYPSVSSPQVQNMTIPKTQSPLLESLIPDTNTNVLNNNDSILPFLYSGWFLFFLFLLLSFLGINIFYILSKGSNMVGDVGSGFIGHIKGLSIWIIIQIKSLLNITGEGTKVGVDIISGTAQSSLGLLEKTINHPKHISEDQIGKSKPADTISSGLDIQTPNIVKEVKELIGGNNKQGGYCYVGTDNNVGSCAYVDRNDICMTKRIYPTMNLCINRENTR